MVSKRSLNYFVSATLFLGSLAYGSSYHIQTFGDSLTAGFLSETNVTAPPPLKGVSQIISDLAMFMMTGKKSYLDKYHYPDLAWPEELAKLMRAEGHNVRVSNHAVSASRTLDLMKQVALAKGDPNTTRALFLIGHNDLCDNEDAPEVIADYFESEYRKALTEWDKKHSGSVAYLLPVGEVHRLYKTLHGYAWYNNGRGKYTCEDSWEKFFPYCPSYSKRFKAGTLDQFLVPRINAMNTRLDKVANDFNMHSDGGNRVKYLNHTNQLPFEKEHFAIDCYHLSNVGQKNVANEIFKETKGEL